MKIKIMYLFVHLGYGGTEVGLLTTLKNINRSRFDVTVVSIEKKGPIGEEIESLGFKVLYLNAEARLYNIPLIPKIVDILKAHKPDILHTSLFYANFFGRIAAMFYRPKAILTEERSMYTEKRFYHVILDRLLSRMTDKIIVCSRSVLDFTAKQEGISKDKFFLIYNAVDSDRFDVKEPKDLLRKRYDFSGQDFIVGTVGSIIPKKGHRYLIEAAAGLTNEIRDLKIIVVGDGCSKVYMKKLAAFYGLSDKIIFLGNRKDVPQLMKIMDIFVLPSLQEGFPRTVIEAMYMGLPVIASNISGIPEIINDGSDGFLIPTQNPGALMDRIRMLYKDYNLKEKIGINARKRVGSRYSPEYYVKTLDALYNDLIRNKKTGRV